MEKMGKLELTPAHYRSRDAARAFLGKKYEHHISSYRKIIEEYQDEFSLDVLQSTAEICSSESVNTNGTAIIMFMAAAVEMINPS